MELTKQVTRINSVADVIILVPEGNRMLSLPIFHCRRCHRSFIPRKSKIPTACGRCKSRTWNQFPPEFDPKLTDCDICRLTWEKIKSEGETPALSERKRRQPKKHTDEGNEPISLGRTA